MRSTITLHPQHELKPGRYLLDREGRLHPDRYSGFIKAVAAVTIKCKPALNIEDEFVVIPTVDKTGTPTQDYSEKPVAMPVVAAALIDATPAPAKLPHPDRGNLRQGTRKKPDAAPVKRVVAAVPKPAPRIAANPSAPRTKADGYALFDRVLDRVKEAAPARARRIEKPAEPFDPKAYAAAREREKQHKARKDAIKLPPMVRALSAEACGMCGASGRNGCDHYLPFEG